MADTQQQPDGEGFFWANNPNINMRLRERIALQMMSQKKGYPKTVGEGLTAVGDAIGDRMTMARLEQADLAQQAASRRDMAGGGAAPAAVPGNYQGNNSAITAAPPVVSAAPPARPAAAMPATIGSVDDPSPMDPPAGAERDAVVRTMVTEGGNQGPEGLQAVANVIRNRAINGGFPGGNTAGGVVAGPHQFEGYARNGSVDPNSPAYAQAGAALDRAYTGDDPTRGAVNFINPDLQRRLGRQIPNWAQGPPSSTVGAHQFFGGAPPPDPRAAVTSALVAQQNGPAVPPPPNPTQSGPEAVPVQVASANPTASLPTRGPEQQITPLPPQPQPITPRPVRTAQAQPDPGYVPPPIADPEAPSLTPLSPREQYLRKLSATSNNDYTKAAAQEELQQLEAVRTNTDARNKEAHGKRLEYVNQYNLKREELLSSQQKRIDDNRKAVDERRKPTDIDNKYIQNEDGSYSPVKITGVDANAPPAVTLSESQSKTLTNHGRAARAHEDLKGKETLLAEGGKEEAIGKVPFFGNKLQEGRYKLAKNAADNFVQAFIRQTSGGAYGKEELELEARAMLPKFGDNPAQIEQKRQQREDFINRMYGGLGSGGQRVSDYYNNKSRTERTAKQETIAKEMGGVEKVVGKPYRKGGVTRVWNGSEWEEH